MSSNGLPITGKIIFSTGNIMSINDITKKPSQNSTQELTDAIKFTLKEYTRNGDGNEQSVKFISRADDIQAKIQENDLDDLKIGLKVFLTSGSEETLTEALETALKQQLKINSVSDVIVSFKKDLLDDKKDNLEEIKTIWKYLETYVDNKIVGELGIADIEENTFRALYDWATIKPSIIQINLATCCVVPPTLQAFCKEHDIKLFTHSDSNNILPEQSIEEIFGRPLDLQWAVRFTIHIKCRGVLITKGYCLCICPNRYHQDTLRFLMRLNSAGLDKSELSICLNLQSSFVQPVFFTTNQHTPRYFYTNRFCVVGRGKSLSVTYSNFCILKD